MYSKILVALDGSSVAEQALPYARLLARALEAPLELLAVVDLRELLTSVDKVQKFDQLIDAETRRAQEYLQTVAKRFPSDSIKVAVEQGGTADVIIEKAAADKSTLVAMATHGRSGLNRWLMGSVAEKVLRGSTNPLLLVRALPNGKTAGEAFLKSMIVPLDGSELADMVLPTVVRIARQLDLEVLLLRAYSNPYAAFGGGSGPYAVNLSELTAGLRAEARPHLEEKLAWLKKQGLAKALYLLEEGDAADKIVAAAGDAPNRLVVMCSHGRSGVKRWALGSVAETVVRHSRSPILVMRGVAVTA